VTRKRGAYTESRLAVIAAARAAESAAARARATARRLASPNNSPKAKPRRSGDTAERAYGARLRRDFGVCIPEYLGWLAAQGNACPICRRMIVPGYSQTVEMASHRGPRRSGARIDVDPITEKIRGLLCNQCHTGLRMFYDSPSRLQRAGAYIQAHVAAQPE